MGHAPGGNLLRRRRLRVRIKRALLVVVDNRSFALNDELNLAVYDTGVAGRLAEVFEADLRRSRRVEYADWANRGLTTRL